MAFALVVVISLLSVFTSVQGFPNPQDLDQQKVSLTKSEVTLGTECGDKDYYDIRTETRLYFFAYRKARRRIAPVGTNKQLQCRAPAECLDGGGLDEAVCFNSQGKSSSPHWICEAMFPDMRYSFYRTDVNCERHPDANSFCVLRDSCILIYEPYKPISRFLIFAITTFVVFLLFCIFATIYSMRRHRAELRAPTAVSAGAGTAQNDYDPSTDVPPSYNTVERNPKRYSKPNITILSDRSMTETPPPPYESVSDEESCKF